MGRLDSLLGEGEHVLWRGKPRRAAYAAGALPAMVVSAMFLTVPAGLFYLSTIRPTGPDGQGTIWLQLFLLPFLVAGIAGVLLPLGNFLAAPNVEYVLTDRRVLITGGVVARDVKSVRLENVVDIDLRIRTTDRLFGTGTIELFAGHVEGRFGRSLPRAYRLQAVDNPYEAVRLIQNAVDGRRGN